MKKTNFLRPITLGVTTAFLIIAFLNSNMFNTVKGTSESGFMAALVVLVIIVGVVGINLALDKLVNSFDDTHLR